MNTEAVQLLYMGKWRMYGSYVGARGGEECAFSRGRG